MLLVLGSKPDPKLPVRAQIRAVACANASGRSAARLGLPDPLFTVVSALLASGHESDRHNLRALHGLRTGTLFLLPRPLRGGGFAQQLWRRTRNFRMEPAWCRLALWSAGYRWQRFEVHPMAHYSERVLRLCGDDAELREQVARKHPSSGVVAVMLALELGFAERVVISGMSFELTHAHGLNPAISLRGTTASQHADTDVMVLSRLARRSDLFTSEPIVAERTGIPLLAAQ